MLLASTDDVAKALGRPLSPGENATAEHVLSLLSEKFCQEARCTFQRQVWEHRCKVNGQQVRPPRSPLVSVEWVRDDASRPLPFQVRAGYIQVPAASHELVTVRYTAGYESVPRIVTLQIADAAKRALSTDPKAAAGYTQTSTTAGPYTESGTFATWAVGGQVLLSPDDVALARSLRPRRRGNVWVCGAR